MGVKGHHPSSSESDDWGDEGWTVDCPCGVNYDDGEEMVECDECEVWVHTICCRVPKGLPTYVCDKCKARNKLKESESEVAQLLAELPDKPISFDERMPEKFESYPGHHNFCEMSIEKRAHVHGIPGGDVSFFDGASGVFSPQLWMHAGYIPKSLKVDRQELPGRRDDVEELLQSVEEEELAVYDVIIKNSIAILTGSEVDLSQGEEELSHEKARLLLLEDAVKAAYDRMERILSKGEVKASSHRPKPKIKEERPVKEKSHHSAKRARDEGGAKELASKKKTKSSGDVHKPEDGQLRKVDASPSQEAVFVSKSPQCSPKNPKAMKKLAVQEFMDGDVMLCSSCGNFNLRIDRASLRNGLWPGGRSDTSCRGCESLDGDPCIGMPKFQTVMPTFVNGSVKQEEITLSGSSIINPGISPEVKILPRKELDYCESDMESGRLRDDVCKVSSDGGCPTNSASLCKEEICNDFSQTQKMESAAKVLQRSGRIQDNLEVLEEKRHLVVKMVSNAFIQHQEEGTEVGGVEGVQPTGVTSAVGSQLRGESVGHFEQDAEPILVARASSTGETEAPSPCDLETAVTGNKQVVPVQRCLPEILPDSLSSSKQAQAFLKRRAAVPEVPVSAGFVQTEPTKVNGATEAFLERILPASSEEVMTENAKKHVSSIISTETKGQGSARTAGHLPASVRGRMWGERVDSWNRSISGSACQHQASTLSGQSPVQLPVSGPQPSVHCPGPVFPPMKGVYGKDTVVGKQHGQVQVDGISPTQQVGKLSSNRFVCQQMQLQQATVAPQSPALSDMPSPSRPSCEHPSEPEHQLHLKGPSAEVENVRDEILNSAGSPKQPKVVSGCASDTNALNTSSPTQVSPPQVLCQHSRQLNGLGHVYMNRPKVSVGPTSMLSNCSSIYPPGTSQAPNAVLSNMKVSVSSLKSPSSGTSSSSPTSPLVTTPSSKPQSISAKVPGSPPPQKSISGGSTPKTSDPAPHSSSKFLISTNSTTSISKQAGTLHPSKSVPSLPASPLSFSPKVTSMSKQSSRSNSLPVTKVVDVSSSLGKSVSSITPSRGGNHSGSSSGGLLKESVKNTTHPSSKSSTPGKTTVKLPSASKSLNSHVHPKGASGTSVSKQHSGSGSGISKTSTLPSTTKYTAASKVRTSQKDEKPIMPSAPPVPKAMSAMPPPPPPQVLSKRSPPTVLTSSVASTLKDEELALLLHQELNSSPRVPRVPRVRQPGSLQMVSSPPLSSAKVSFVSAASGGSSFKDHHLAPRKRTREDRHKESKSLSSTEEVGKSAVKRAEDHKVDNVKGSSEKVGYCGTVDASAIKDKLSVSTEGNARHHGKAFSKSNLSIIVPGNDDAPDGDKKSPIDSSSRTLPGFIEAVLNSRGHHTTYEDICEAVLPHWPKLRKPNGDRYAYANHRKAVLDCLRNRSAWAHLGDRGPKANLGRKRRRNDATISDTDEEEYHFGYRDYDEWDTGKPSKGAQGLDEEKWDVDASDWHRSVEVGTGDDVPKGKRRARRRRKVAIEDGTDGEEEPSSLVERKGPGAPKPAGETNQDEEPEAESSPSSEEAVSNYSEEDEEMVVHRSIRNRRRPPDNESSDSEDDVD